MTETDASPAALPVWNVPCEAVIERTDVWLKRSHVGVKSAWPFAEPCVTVSEDCWAVAPIGQATATARWTPPPEVPVS